MYSISDDRLLEVLRGTKTLPCDIQKYILDTYESDVPNIGWGLRIINQDRLVIYNSSIYEFVSSLSFFGPPVTLKIVKKTFLNVKILNIINIEKNKKFYKKSIFLNLIKNLNTWLSFIFILKIKNDTVYCF